jgi:hypothetical protein
VNAENRSSKALLHQEEGARHDSQEGEGSLETYTTTGPRVVVKRVNLKLTTPGGWSDEDNERARDALSELAGVVQRRIEILLEQQYNRGNHWINNVEVEIEDD